MNYSDILIILFIFFVGSITAAIGTALTGLINHFLINKFLNESTFRIILSLFLVSFASFVSSFIGMIGILGFAADENAGEIIPYFIRIK